MLVAKLLELVTLEDKNNDSDSPFYDYPEQDTVSPLNYTEIEIDYGKSCDYVNHKLNVDLPSKDDRALCDESETSIFWFYYYNGKILHCVWPRCNLKLKSVL